MQRAAWVLWILLALATSASAQNKFSGSAKCAKPDKELMIYVGDTPDHSFYLMQSTCTYTKGTIDGIQVKEEVDTGFYEARKDISLGRFSGVLNMTNGDQAHIEGDDTVTLKDGVPLTGGGKWSFTDGTGKLKRLKGKGTFKAIIAADGTSTIDIQGEYKLAK